MLSIDNFHLIDHYARVNFGMNTENVSTPNFINFEDLMPDDVYAYYDPNMHDVVLKGSGISAVRTKLQTYLFIAFQDLRDNKRITYTCVGEGRYFSGVSAFRKEQVWKLNVDED